MLCCTGRPLENINPQTSDFGHSDIPALLTALLALDGVTVCVASFGRHDVIKKAIRCALPEELATQVFVTTPGDFEGFQCVPPRAALVLQQL